MLSFQSLRTRLAVLYGGLFTAAMILISVGVYSAISTNVRSVVRGELAASGTVFDRVWALRTLQLQSGAGLLSRDFGFREAIATQDDATIASALENLKRRLGIEVAFMIRTDGRIVGEGERPALDGPTLASLQADDAVTGVLVLGSTPYEAVSIPVLAPVSMGWVVFATRIDQPQLRALERLSAIPLDASILIHDPHRGWQGRDRRGVAQIALDRFVNDQLRDGPQPAALNTPEGPVIGLVKPIQAVGGGLPVVLFLKYPLSRAMAPYQPLLAGIVGGGLLGIILLIVGSWGLASSVTRPLSKLGEAAQRLRRGEDAQVAIEGDAEVASLAEGFNAMAAEIVERERRILHLAMHDAESRLANRQALEGHIGAQAGAGPMVVAAIGIDRLNQVRGAIGHEATSGLIGRLGERMARVQDGVMVARLSTGVLGAAFPVGDKTNARKTAEALAAVANEPIRLGDSLIDVSLSTGLAWRGADDERPGLAIERSSIALDQARESHQKLAWFDAARYGDPAANLSLMGEMRRAIAGEGLILHYQPKFDLNLKRTTGVEALVRWRHPARGMIGPDLFVPMAEETGHIHALTDWVLGAAIADQRAMFAAGYPLSVSVNISGQLLGDADFARGALAAAGSAIGELCFEITETAVIENPEEGLAAIDRFAAAGVAVSIDDYGTGLSSLAYLKQIRAHELKIDKSFIMTLAENERDALLVRSTIDLAHGLGLRVTAEGVETREALSRLTLMGCDLVQGHLVSRPAPLEAILAFMDREA